MGWRFRKSFSPLPGVRLTFSPSGMSTSVGMGPMRVTKGPRGTSLSARIPGTGISYRQPLSFASNGPSPARIKPGHHVEESSPVVPAPAPRLEPISLVPSLEEIRSAGSGIMTSEGLKKFKALLEQAQKERETIKKELGGAELQETAAVGEYARWKNGWLLRRILKKKFESLRVSAEEATAFRVELEEQLSLSGLETFIDMPEYISKQFSCLSDDFSFLSQAIRIWDTVGQRTANRAAERTTATRIVERKEVSFKLGQCGAMESDLKVPHLANANGGDLFLYPGFVLYFVSADSFALIEYRDVKMDFQYTNFIEDESVPADSQVVGQAWEKANKDGSPDLRFKGNRQIPIARYGKIVFESSSGMNEEYMVSNLASAERFFKSWVDLLEAVTAGV